MSRAVFSTSLRNKALLLLPLLMLAGCGFSPLYGHHGQTSQSEPILEGIKIDPVSGRPGQLFTAELEDQLNPSGKVPATAKYRLNTKLTLSEAAIGVARDGTVSRYNIYLDSYYQLYRIADGQLMTSGNLRHVSSYNNTLNEYYSTYVAQEDAYKRGVTELAQLFRQRIGAYLTQNNGNPPIQKPKEQKLMILPENPGSQNTIAPPIQPYNITPVNP
jgi:LPS-assembly lipoprotein